MITNNNMPEIWQTQILSTLDMDYVNVPIHLFRANRLAEHLQKGKPCYLVLNSELSIEIVNVIRVFYDIITIERGLKGTYPTVWPAGSRITAKITSQMLQELHLDKSTFLTLDDRAVVTPEGDIITLPC